MRLNSHIILANYIADIIESVVGIKLERDMLELGSIYPDVNLRRRLRTHNARQLINNYYIQTENIINKSKNKWGVSFTIGMLSHYICDTFCLAHNMKMRTIGDFKRHVKYEVKLDKIIEKYKLSDDVKLRVKAHVHNCLDFDLDDFVAKAKGSYLNEADFYNHNDQYIKDVEESIFAGAIIALGFIYELEKAQCPAVQVLHI